MKRTILPYLTGWLIATTLLFSCVPEETEEADIAGTSVGLPLLISVTDGGLLPSNGSSTRATDTDLRTIFTPGDSIGLYAIKDGAIIEAGANIALILSSSGQWNFARGQELYYNGQNSGILYYAYYPYRQGMENQITETDTGDDRFFAPLIRNWTPAEDQSDYAAYTASDLMTGSGIVGGAATGTPHPLTITLTHRMALAIVKTPTFNYTTTQGGDVQYHPDAISSFPITWTSRLKGYQTEAGTYRYIGNPATNVGLKGSYNQTATFDIPFSLIRHGSYDITDMTAIAPPTILTRALAIGDFYMDNGTVVPKEIFALPSGCIGVVLKVGRDTSGDWNDDSNYMLKNSSSPMTTINGYVLALYDSNLLTRWMVWYVRSMNTEQFDSKGFYGYRHTQQIKQYISDNGYNPDEFYTLFYATVDPERNSPAPTNSSGWFMPSSGQYQYWINNSEQLLFSFRKVKGEKDFNWIQNYWSSSEDGNVPSENAWLANMKNRKMEIMKKDFWAGVAAVLAF